MLCGIDEAGRGPFCGPVSAAAVILDPTKPIAGLTDSKKLSAKKREALAEEIKAKALAWHIAFASVEEIDALNILKATMLAMTRAVEGLSRQPTQAVVDGNKCPPLNIPCRAIIKGDLLVPEISAASILAKTARDAVMLQLHAQYPAYGLDQHMGYGTAQHIAALKLHGPSPIHRKSFAPIAELLAQRELVLV